MRIAYQTMYEEFLRVLKKCGMDEIKAAMSASLFADASLDGVYTHGLNRFPRYISMIKKGIIDIDAQPSCELSLGCLERWNGNSGPGNLNAWACMKRAIWLSKQHTIGAVALSNTNHWMRPGAYGLMAAEAGCIGILWTNTVPNMPPWGSNEPKLGNNPVVVAIPHGEVPVLLDVAMSMFSYGKLEMYKMQGKKLPIPGGFNKDGEVTDDPAAILETHHVLPIGYWKGSGLSLVLDLIASVLAGGFTSRMVGELPAETNLSQIFMSINLESFPDQKELEKKIEETLQDLKNAKPFNSNQAVRFPGEGLAAVRKDNTENGIPVDEKVWNDVLAL